MKKYAILGLVLMICSFAIAQKKEVKEIEKAVKNNNFADAKSALINAEALLSSMDDKTKAKFYFFKGQALYANGAGSDPEINEALNSFKALTDFEAQSGKLVYTPQVDQIKLNMSNAFIQKASDALEQKKYDVSAANFDRAYRVSPTDTLYLFNSATVAVMGKIYDKALKIYDELLEMGYTGVGVEYFARDVDTGEEQSFSSETLRSLSIKAGTHDNARNEMSESKVGEMAKNVALIYVEQGDNDKAIEAIERAKLTSPNDFNLLISEANIQYKIGNKEKYIKLVNQALSINPNNVDLYFNLGVIAAADKNYEEASKYYLKAMEIDPTYINAKMNMVALILDQEQGIINEMNDLGSSAADDKKYEELRESRQELYKEAIPYLTDVLESNPDNLSAVKTLMNIYSAVGDEENYKAMKVTADALENNN
jgi:tetratricopeptide (TPR) repeat protein